MKIYNSIENAVNAILNKHKGVTSRFGCSGQLMFRRPNGKIMVFQQFTGFKILDFIISDNRDLSIDHVSIGYTLALNKKIVSTSRVTLHDLTFIEIYKHQAYFYSKCGIDFTYIENSLEVKNNLINGWCDSSSKKVIGKWSSTDSEIDSILDELGHHRTIKVSKKTKVRNIDMET